MQVANCRSGIDPSAGDQSGNEWRVQDWFSYDWNCVLRHPSEDVQNLISSYAINAANNDFCGYSQANRLSFWNALRTVQDYDPKNIRTYVDADCSSSTGAIIKAVGYKLGISALMNVNEGVTTFTMRSELVSAGFQCYTGSYCTSDAYLVAGDVILNESCHVCIAVSCGQNSNVSGNQSIQPQQVQQTVSVPIMVSRLPLLQQSRVGNVCREDTKACQTLLNLRGAELDVDGVYGSGTVGEVKKFQSKVGIVSDGECASQTWEKLIYG